MRIAESPELRKYMQRREKSLNILKTKAIFQDPYGPMNFFDRHDCYTVVNESFNVQSGATLVTLRSVRGSWGACLRRSLQVHLEVDEVLAGAYPYSAAAYSLLRHTHGWCTY
jgi:hypothetical protein